MKPIIIITLLLLLAIVFRYLPATKKMPLLTPPPEKVLTPIAHYNPPALKKAESYTIIFVGDSMTDVLGPNFDELRKDLQLDYPHNIFGLFNYGFGSTNILSVDDRLHHDSQYNGASYPAILNRYFDIIIIESMGHNPLSDYPLDQGLTHQTAALDHLVAEIVAAKPNALIIFMATIAPSRTEYAKGVVKLTQAVRNIWVTERVNYIENHINYAKNHNIPLIDVYHQSLDKNGSAILKYIDHTNFIHPSAAGIKLISQSIADFLKQNNILP